VVLDHSVIPAGTTIGSRLRVEAGTPILRIARRRLVDGEPMSLETIHVLKELVPGIDVTELEVGSFYALLRDHYGIVPTQAVQQLEAAAASTTEAALLGLSAAAPILTLERVTSDQHGRLFEYTRAAYRGDRYRMTSTLDLTGAQDTSAPSITPY
jgi:GntR family transcriptional regulator